MGRVGVGDVAMDWAYDGGAGVGVSEGVLIAALTGAVEEVLRAAALLLETTLDSAGRRSMIVAKALSAMTPFSSSDSSSCLCPLAFNQDPQTGRRERETCILDSAERPVGLDDALAVLGHHL